jgi:hypothetical protein
MSKREFRRIPMTTMANLSGIKEDAKKKKSKQKISATTTSMFIVQSSNLFLKAKFSQK